jgi:hypothetical protein
MQKRDFGDGWRCAVVTHTITALVISYVLRGMCAVSRGEKGRESGPCAVSVYRMYGNACAGWGIGSKGNFQQTAGSIGSKLEKNIRFLIETTLPKISSSPGRVVRVALPIPPIRTILFSRSRSKLCFVRCDIMTSITFVKACGIFSRYVKRSIARIHIYVRKRSSPWGGAGDGGATAGPR